MEEGEGAMMEKAVMRNWEKEAMRRNLLASVILPVGSGGLKGSHNPVTSFWHRLFRKSHIH